MSRTVLAKRRLKNWLSSYVQYASAASEAPEAFHVWTGISTLAATLQRKVWIDEYIFQWTPNFYIIFVGPPGVVTKSTTIRIGADLLRDVDGVVFGPNSLTWQSLTVSLGEASRTIPENPANLDSELHHMSCVTCSVGELGTFLDPTDRKMVDVFTDLWDGQTGVWEHSTKTQGSTQIINPWLNIIAATTPSWLKENFPESMIGGGLTSRIVFVYGEMKKQLVPYPHLVRRSEEHAQLRNDLIHDLNIMNEMLGEYKLTDEAIAWGAAWYEKHTMGERAEHLKNERFEGYIARKQTHMHKLAIILAASQRNELKITSKDLTRANDMVTLLEQDMVRVFESIGASPEKKHMDTMLRYLRFAGGTMSQGQLFAMVQSNISHEDFTKAVTAGVKANYMKLRNDGAVTYIQAVAYPANLSGPHSPQ